MLIKQLSIFVENKKGSMAEIAEIVGGAGVDIRALSLADTTDFGILRLIVDKPEKAVAALKGAGITVSLTDVIGVGVNDSPGGFAPAVRAMSDAGIDIEYMYAFITRTQGRAYVIMRLNDPEAGMAALENSGFKLLVGEDAYNM